VGTAKDLWTAFREDAFGSHPQPFVGWIILNGRRPGSRSPVKVDEPHFDVFPEFKGQSYRERYDARSSREHAPEETCGAAFDPTRPPRQKTWLY